MQIINNYVLMIGRFWKWLIALSCGRVVYLGENLMAPNKWCIGPRIGLKNYSVGMPPHPSRALGVGFSFDFPLPGSGEVDYVAYNFRQPTDIRGALKIKMVYSVSGDGEVLPTEGAEVSGRLRLFIQRWGDNWSGQDEFASYRRWSAEYFDLTPGRHEIECPLDEPSFRIGVFGGAVDPTGFSSTIAAVEHIGFTFGGTFAGHGVYSTKPMLFTVESFQVVL